MKTLISVVLAGGEKNPKVEAEKFLFEFLKFSGFSQLFDDAADLSCQWRVFPDGERIGIFDINFAGIEFIGVPGDP